MKVAKGGTDLWCPECRAIRTCAALPATQVTGQVSDYAQRMHFTKHPDISFFQRGRRCLTCYHDFVATEVEISFLEELIELRGALSQLKRDVDRYSRQSKTASSALSRLSTSLEAVRTLRVYQDADG